MEYTIIERAPDAFQKPVTLEHIVSMCQRAFGEEQQVTAVKELGGGLYNNTYLVRCGAMQPVILRVGPHPTSQGHSDKNLMRNEYAGLPFFAPIAPLLPRILMADFTHQVIERDYMFQSYMEGDQWAQVMETFTSEEKKILWRQLGSITKKIHAVQGDYFGSSALDAHFSSWSLNITHWLTNTIHDLEEVRLDAADIKNLLAIAQANSRLLDEISQPRLLHGDLWTVNILVKRDDDGPGISAVLDLDGFSWGDPLADWTIFLLHRHVDTEADAFWETYGQAEKSLGGQFRALIYQGGHIGGARLEHHRLHHPETVKRSYQDIQAIIEALESLPIQQR